MYPYDTVLEPIWYEMYCLSSHTTFVTTIITALCYQSPLGRTLVAQSQSQWQALDRTRPIGGCDHWNTHDAARRHGAGPWPGISPLGPSLCQRWSRILSGFCTRLFKTPSQWSSQQPSCLQTMVQTLVESSIHPSIHPSTYRKCKVYTILTIEVQSNASSYECNVCM